MNKDSPQKNKKIQTMRQLCVQRKSQNFQNLKKWDQRRASKLIVHRKIVDQIDETLELKLSESNEYTKIVKQFFVDLLSQKNRYLTHHIDNPQAKIQMNTIGRNVYPRASKTIAKLYNSTQNSKQFHHVKRVLQDSLCKIDDFLVQSQKQLMQLRTKIQLLVLQIQDCNMQTLQKCDILVGLYNQSKTLKAFQSQQDFLIEQQHFLSQAKKQLQCQKSLGNQIIEYLQYVQKRQQQKLTVLKLLIGDYINSITHQNDISSQHLINLSDILHKNTQIKYINEYFSVEELLPRQLISELAKVESKHESQISMKFLKMFLRKFQYEEFDNRNLIMKVVKVFLRGKPTMLSNQPTTPEDFYHQAVQSLEPVQILVTVDGFINIYHTDFSNEEEEHRSDQHQAKNLLHNLKMSASLILNRVSDIQLEINVKKWGLMSFTQNQEYSIALIFNSEDQRQEFVEFVTQLK